MPLHPSIHPKESEVLLNWSEGQKEESEGQLEDQLEGSKGLPKGSEVLPEECEVLPEGSEGLSEGSEGLPEGPGASWKSLRAHQMASWGNVHKAGWTNTQNFSLSIF